MSVSGPLPGKDLRFTQKTKDGSSKDHCLKVRFPDLQSWHDSSSKSDQTTPTAKQILAEWWLGPQQRGPAPWRGSSSFAWSKLRRHRDSPTLPQTPLIHPRSTDHSLSKVIAPLSASLARVHSEGPSHFGNWKPKPGCSDRSGVGSPARRCTSPRTSEARTRISF